MLLIIKLLLINNVKCSGYSTLRSCIDYQHLGMISCFQGYDGKGVCEDLYRNILGTTHFDFLQ
jgi:hypothetical protein